MIQLSQLGRKSEFGLVINWKFHKQNRWVSALAPYLVNAIIQEFDPLIISSQVEYELHKKKLRFIISMEPGWAAPTIKYDNKKECIKSVFYSDPHYETEKRRKYLTENNFDYVFSLYNKPFFYHFKGFPESKFVHMPWAIPNQYISAHLIEVRSSDVVIFGAQNSDAYDVRNWCREQEYIKNYNYSGVENKKMTDEDYFKWLSQFDAIVAAGSSNPIYDLVTPKYFEIASTGALLIGQDCGDLENLGFNEQNAVVFTKKDFKDKVLSYKNNPDSFIDIRNNGRELIRSRHKVSDRIKLIKEVMHGK